MILIGPAQGVMRGGWDDRNPAGHPGKGGQDAATVRPRGPGAWSLPEVRWAALATALFTAGLATRLAHGPAWPAWALFLACYAAGGWEPGLAGLRALRGRSWTWTC